MVQLLIEQGEQLRHPRSLAATLDTLSQHAPNFVLLVRNRLSAQLTEED